jgi:hypothetical protein
MPDFNPFGQMLQAQIAGDRFNQQKQQNAFSQDMQTQQLGNANERNAMAQQLQSRQMGQLDQADAMKRLEMVGKTGVGFLKLSPEQQQMGFGHYAQQLNQVMPGTVPEGMQWGPEAQQHLTTAVQTYAGLQTPKYTTKDGQFIPTQPGQGVAQAIPGYEAPAQKASPATDIDDYVADAELARGGDKAAAARNVDRLAIKRAQKTEQAGILDAKQDVKLKTEPLIAERKKFAEMQGSQRSKRIDKGFEKIQSLQQNIGNLDDAIAAVSAGAGTGAITKRFPSIKGTSVLLDQVQGALALDVIGSVTFGALSEGELNLAKSIAIPTGLEGPELIKWLQDKKAAQEKLLGYFKEQVDFLDQGGSIAGFLRGKERGSAGQQPTAQGQQDITTQEQYDNLPSGTVYTEDGKQYRKP